MKYYERHLLERTEINKYGKLGYKPIMEYVKTNNIDTFNKGLRIKFCEASDSTRKELRRLDVDHVYKLYED